MSVRVADRSRWLPVWGWRTKDTKHLFLRIGWAGIACVLIGGWFLSLNVGSIYLGFSGVYSLGWKLTGWEIRFSVGNASLSMAIDKPRLTHKRGIHHGPFGVFAGPGRRHRQTD